MTGTMLITGASGQLGQEFARIGQETGRDDLVFWTRETGNICDPDIGQRIRDLSPGLLINCAAYTAVDQAEEEAAQAYQVNAEAVRNLGIVAQDLGIPVIHFSSDYVYHNQLRRPLLETDPVRPKSVYAKSKLKGEQYLMAHHAFPLIFRVSWLYSTFGRNFPKTIRHLASQREHLNVVCDQVGVPTYARDLALAIMKIVDHMRSLNAWQQVAGIYNYSNEGMTNWAEIADFIVRFDHLPCRINPIPGRQYPTRAARPRYSKLNLSKFRETFKQPIRPWQEALAECLSELQTKEPSMRLSK